jgi:hypothetical protein
MLLLFPRRPFLGHTETAVATLKTPLYAIQHPDLPGLYFRLDGQPPRLTRIERACLAPATRQGLTWLVERSAQLSGIPHELVRLDA